jgi:hypothetical protein
MYGSENHARPILYGPELHAKYVFLNTGTLVKTVERQAFDRVKDCTKKVLKPRTIFFNGHCGNAVIAARLLQSFIQK